ncbi:MAG: hypothetical protein D6806_08010 [Deltaproteobacteria bacterium]|nr:MAG: hypothetical protein D6806_08010 [Deltaproteobacteria bacterium]
MKTLPRYAWLAIMLVIPSVSCGGAKLGGKGDFCEKDKDCKAGLVCKQNICIEPGTNDCDPPCPEDQVCRSGKCEPITPNKDQDGDGFDSSADCDDLDATVFPADPTTSAPGGFEYCDGRDNDCDGETDEDCPPCREGVVVDCGTDIGECTVGTQTCSGGKLGPCSGTGPQAEIPDGLDNDCDGSTDEGLPCNSGDTMPCGVDVGECQSGMQSCGEDGTWLLCQGAMPGMEKCNGLDDDCDGITDDGFMVGTGCDGAGLCGEGTYECSSQTSIRCSTEPGGSQDQSQQEKCNGLDEDCDGQTDEDFGIGESCVGQGLCGNGVKECLNDNTAICSTEPGGSQDQSQPEVCDGFDNDCDGDRDEDFGVGQPCQGTGACGEVEGVIECADEQTTRCSTDPGGSQDASSPEICDGKDNDCDGETDEGEDLDLCSPLPPNVINAVCDRNAGACRIPDPATDCDLGWWDFDGDFSNGCEASDDGEGNGCSQAIELQALNDVGDPAARRVEVTARLIPAGDEDWYSIRGVDVMNQDESQDGCDAYHVAVKLIDQPPGVFFDVRLDSCSAAPACKQDTVYEFMTDQNVSGMHECPCSVTPSAGKNTCSDNTHTYLIRVYRLAGEPVSDQPYTLEITNGP